MSEQEREGRCLCGAVHVVVMAPLTGISACHCENCTRWSGGIQMGIGVDRSRVKLCGPVKTHQSSAIAERAWCDVCGSAVWFRYTQGRDEGYLELVPGLFANFGGARVTCLNYADKAPDGFALAGDFERITKDDYETRNPHVEVAR